MARRFRRLAALLLLIAALSNGVFAPLAHGHAFAGAAPDGAVTLQADSAVEHAGCHSTNPDDEGNPAGHAGGKHPGNSGLLCSGATACCAAVAVLDLPVVEHRQRVAPRDSPRPVPVGLSPVVGERPPSHT